jgi:xanthosine utilization system XapX-like protein
VLYGHSIEPLFIREDTTFVESGFWQWRVIYSFHMPLFFFLSGAARTTAREAGGASSAWRRSLRDALALLLFAELTQLAGGALYALDSLRQGNRDLLGIAFTIGRGALLLCDLRLGIMWYVVSLAVVILLAAAWDSGRLAARGAVIAACVASVAAGWRVGPEWDIANNWFQVRSWMPGLVFYSLGRAFTGRYPPAWMGGLAMLALVAIAPLNRGCPTDPTQTCPDIAHVFAPWMILGRHGFLPFFYLAAALGCVGVLGLARALRIPGLAYLGRVSLPMYVVNAVFLGFVLMKLTRVRVPPNVGVLTYVGIFVGTLVIHLVATWIARRPIDACRAACARWATRIVARVTASPAASAVTGSSTP